MADRIVVMNHGVIEQVGTPTQVYRHPASLFVADFIGETNKFDATLQDGKARIGELVLSTTAPAPSGGERVKVAIRPEDILPVAKEAPAGANRFEVHIEDMEFLGSYWRTHLGLGDLAMVANFSMNAVRRMGIEIGGSLTVEFPAERVLLFPGATT